MHLIGIRGHFFLSWSNQWIGIESHLNLHLLLWCYGGKGSYCSYITAKERVTRKAVRNQGYLLIKMLKTHELTLTEVFHHPLSWGLFQVDCWFFFFGMVILFCLYWCNWSFPSVFCENKCGINHPTNGAKEWGKKGTASLITQCMQFFHTINLW